MSRGGFHRLFAEPGRLGRYACCILIGVPIWYVIGILITFAPELARALDVAGAVTGSKSIMWSYVGLSLGDLSAGLLSQKLKSRKKSVLVFLGMMMILIAIYVLQRNFSPLMFYILCGALGFSAGYWAVFVTIGAEQFGTNIRATVATTVPNFVRGSVVPVTLSFHALKDIYGLVDAVWMVGAAVMIIALVALYFLRETYGRNLDYYEAL